MDKETKWDKGKFSKRKPVSDEDKRAIAEYYQAGLKTAKSSEELLAELAERYDRSSRQIQRYIVQVRAWEGQQELSRVTRVTKKSYEETPHKQKMRELAERLIGEISLPWILDSFIVDLKPQRILYENFRGHRKYPPIIIAENEKISIEVSIEGKGEIDHLQRGLRKHLETGGFSKVLDDIGIWKQGIADNLVRCHKLLRLVRKKIEKSYNVSVPIDDRGQPGFTMYFPMTICADGIEQAMGSNHFRDFPYRYEGLGLRFGSYLIYQGVQNQDLKPYEAAHRKLGKRCASWKQTREIAEQRNSLYETQADIRQQMQKFIDMERLPGQCELCS